MVRLAYVAASLLLAAQASAALSQTKSEVQPKTQTASSAPTDCPGGDWTTIRVSVLKPTGTVAGLRKAVADHAKWYRDHGYTTDRFAFGQVMAYNPALKRRAPVPNKFVTLRWHSSDVPRAKQDAAWDAYVAEYAANSVIESTTVACMIP